MNAVLQSMYKKVLRKKGRNYRVMVAVWKDVEEVEEKMVRRKGFEPLNS